MSKPSVEDLQEHLKNLVRWEIFAIHLPGIERKDIDIINRDRRDDTVGQKQCLYDVWLRAYPDASWEDVIHALEKVKENEIAKNIREKFHVNETAMSPKPSEEAPRDLLHVGTGAVTSKIPVAKHVVDELEKLDKDFNTLTSDVRSNIQTEVDIGVKSLEYFVQRTKDLRAFEINFPPLVQTTDQFFDAIRPHYNFLDCSIVIRLALQLTSTEVHTEANAYNRRVYRFLNTKKVEDLQQKLEPYFNNFRPGDKIPVTLTLQKVWGRQNLYFVKQLVQTLFADDIQHSDQLQWFSVTTKCFIVGFLAPVQLEINLIKCSKMKLKFMRLTGIIGLEINNKQILIEDEDDMFSAEKCLKEAKRNSDIEAVKILQIFLYENPEKQEAYLPQLCGCGKCAIVGWRTEISSQNTASSQFSSLLITDHEHLSDLFFADDNDRHNSLCIVTSDLIHQFQLVVSNIWNHLGTSIQENDLDIFSIADALSNEFDIQLPMFPDLDSIQNYFHLLRVSWYNFRLLHLLVSQVMTKSNTNLLADWNSYLARFEQYSSIYTLDHFSSVFFRLEEQNILILEVDELTSKYKLLDIDRIRNSLSTVIGCSSLCLNLLAVRAEMLLVYIHYCYSDYLTIFKSITPEQLKKISQNKEYRILSITDLHSQFKYENIQTIKDQPIKSTEASETAQHNGISSGTHDASFEVESEKELKHESHQDELEMLKKQSKAKDAELQRQKDELEMLKKQLKAKDAELQRQKEQTQTLRKDFPYKETQLSMKVSELNEVHEHMNKMKANDVLREHAIALTNAITPCLNQVATALQAKNLISLVVKGKILQTTGVSPIDKARQLVCNLQFSLRGYPSPDKYLIDVAQVLHSQGDYTLTEIANSIQLSLGVYGKIKVSPGSSLDLNIQQYSDILRCQYNHQHIVETDWPTRYGHDFFGMLILLEIKDNCITANTLEHKAFYLLRGKVDKISDWDRSRSITTEDVLKPNNDHYPLRVVVDGPPGIGKTTLCRKILQMWACGEITHEVYDLVLYCPLKNQEVANASTLNGLFTIRHQKIPSIVDWIAIRDGKGLLIIFDGWEELSEQDRRTSLAAKIIRREQFFNCSVIVTSRTYASASLLKLPSIDRHVEVLGFSENEVKEVIRGTLEDPDQAQKLIENLKIRGDALSLCYIPLICSIVISISRTREQFPVTLTELYHDLILLIIRRHVEINHNLGVRPEQINSLVDLPSFVGKPMNQLCKLAYDGLKEKSPRMTFTTSQLESGLEDAAKRKYFGLMTTFTVFGYESHHFLHLTIQKFLAAMWIADNNIEEEVFKKYYGIDHFRMCLRFVAGLTHLKNIYDQVIKSMQDQRLAETVNDQSNDPSSVQNFQTTQEQGILSEHWNEEHNEFSSILFAFQVLYEAQDISYCQKLAEDLDFEKIHSLCLHDQNLSPFDMLCVSYFLQNSNMKSFSL